MRRYTLLIALALTVAIALAGCHPVIEQQAETISVYATFYPIYALTEAVMHDIPDAQLRLLAQPQDGCLRDYQLSDWDLSLLNAGADAVIMGGRGLESFESTLFQWGETGPAMSAVLYNLQLYNQDAGAPDGESESHLEGANPHLYMSLEGAARMVESIAAAMQTLDPRFSDLYVKNAQDTVGTLLALLARNRETLDAIRDRRVILMNEALIYIAEDYDLEVADWVDRESGEALYDDALDRCLDRLSEAEARVVLIEKQAPQAFVEAIEAAGFSVARIDVFSTHHEGEGFDVYIKRQEENALAICDAFASAQTGEDIH